MKLNTITATLITTLVKKAGITIFVGRAIRLHSATQNEEIITGIQKPNSFPFQATANKVIGTSTNT